MKILLSLISLAILTSCSTEPGACAGSTVIGSWSHSPETLRFLENCTFESEACESTGTYPKTTASSGAIQVTIASSGGASNCLPVGDYNCTFALDTDASPNTLAVDCGGGTVSYTKN